MVDQARRFAAITACTFLFAATGCFTETGALRLDRYEGVPGMEQVTLLRVEDERGVGPDFLGRNLVGYVFIPVMAQTHRSERPIAEGVAQTFIKALESRSIRARYRPELQQPPEKPESGTQAYVNLNIKQLELKNPMLHLIVAFVPWATKWRSHVEFEISATQTGQAEPFWSGVVSGQGRSSYDTQQALEEIESGMGEREYIANLKRVALDAAMDEAFDAFFRQVDLNDLPMAGPTPPVQRNDFTPLP